MALDAAQERVIDQILERARDGRLRQRAFSSGNVTAGFVPSRPNEVRVQVTGETARAQVNDWVSTCAAKAGHAQQRPSPRQDQIFIDMRLN
jgi:hypothetical protein